MEIVKVWRYDGFRLSLWDTFTRDSMGKAILRYRLLDRGKLLFDGDDFHCSPMHCVDSMETVASILVFLSLKPGDTDDGYFADYNDVQREFSESYRAELLGYYAMAIEERCARKSA